MYAPRIQETIRSAIPEARLTSAPLGKVSPVFCIRVENEDFYVNSLDRYDLLRAPVRSILYSVNFEFLQYSTTYTPTYSVKYRTWSLVETTKILKIFRVILPQLPKG